MKRFWMNVAVTLGTTLVTGAIVSACAHNDASLFIRQVFAPTTPANGTCAYTADPTQAEISGGFVDVAFPIGTYTPSVLVGNQILTQANQNQLQAETSRIVVHGAQTRITDLAGDSSIIAMLSTMCGGGGGDQAACATGKKLVSGALATPVNPFSTVEATAIEPGTGTAPGYASIAITLVDSATIAVLRDYFLNTLAISGASAAIGSSIQLLTYTKAEGTTLGGDSEESNEFEFPVTFTFGQLILNLKTTSGAVGYCLDSQATSTTATACTPGQDQASLLYYLPPPITACPLPSDAASGG